MKITLFLNDKLYDFFLPSQIAGSYSFDADPNEDIKLINVEERNGEWVLYSTPQTSVIVDNAAAEEYILKDEKYLLIVRDNTKYLIYVSPIQEKELRAFSFMPQSVLVIGDTAECNVNTPLTPLPGTVTRIEYQGTQMIITTNNNSFLYANNKKIPSGYIIKIGDIIQILNLKLHFLKDMVIINNPGKKVEINSSSANILPHEFPNEQLENKEVKDIELYSKKDYYSKSPRIRRTIEHKNFKLDSAPEDNANKDNLPLIITLGPMLSMGVTSGITLLNTIISISNGTANIKNSWMALVSGVVMLLTSLVWPILTNMYNKHLERVKKRHLYQKYCEYLGNKKEEFEKEKMLEAGILEENLHSNEECVKIISMKGNGLWDKRKDQDDFFQVRVGIGNVPLDMKIEYPDSGFSVEQTELRAVTDNLVKEYKYLENVPVGYSLYDNYLTAVMGNTERSLNFVDNILLQIMTFYSYDEIKIMVFTTKENEDHWKYVKFSNYSFNDSKSIRYFASTQDEDKELCDYLMAELNYRMELEEGVSGKSINPYYLIICDDYSVLKKINFFKSLTESNRNLGYSILFINSSLSSLPSKCSNFINLSDGTSAILKNSYESQEIINFKDEIQKNIDMMDITRILSNIPIEVAGGASQLPNSLSFLEMEKIGKVEQLNVLNRWNTNDSVQSLKAEIGVDEDGNNLYLDIHEKTHGPHGLIAGMTGSGKSEFIITYILSLAMNFSPDDVAFILIDYKGGGLAGAFENKQTGVKLPHLAGTITNLDKAEMSRTLVSIDSEVKRRQAMFNEARDSLGESTIDIYKYQQFYHEGKLKEPIPHLLIISDEFAELKAQQPDFMDNLISVARIGRSLGVHLILATQKPSGVVDDQIWSNTKFRVCLKVQDASDSNEMLKKPDAASIKQAGRFYIQVGYDEYYALGQSGWCGAKYFPSDTIVKQVDNSINFINNTGRIIKSIQDTQKNTKVEAQGEQLAAVLNEIINTSKSTNKFARTLWLDNIPEIVTLDSIEKKYNITHEPYNINITIGEYDAPELQEQGKVVFNPLELGNTVIYGIDGGETEKLLLTMITSGAMHHKPEELTFYVVDFGSESLRSVMQLPQIGGFVFNGETDKFNSLFKLLDEEKAKRKKQLINYGGDFKNYIKSSPTKDPLIVVIMNNYDAIGETYDTLYDTLPEYVRDSERYGIVYIFTGNSERSIPTRISGSIKNIYALHLKDQYDYVTMFPVKTKLAPRDMVGRGLFLDKEAVHEFQTASLVENQEKQNEYINKLIEKQKVENPKRAKSIPTLPDHVKLENVSEALVDLINLPVGMSRETLDIKSLSFKDNLGVVISSNKLDSCLEVVKSIIQELNTIKTIGCIVLDGAGTLEDQKNQASNYYNSNFDEVFDKICNFIDMKTSTGKPEKANLLLVIYGINKIITKLNDQSKISTLVNKLIEYEKMNVLLIEDQKYIRDYTYEDWFKIFNTENGLWVGKGMGDQSVFKYSNFDKEMNSNMKNDTGYIIEDSTAEYIKLIDFNAKEEDENE